MKNLQFANTGAYNMAVVYTGENTAYCYTETAEANFRNEAHVLACIENFKNDELDFDNWTLVEDMGAEFDAECEFFTAEAWLEEIKKHIV